MINGAKNISNVEYICEEHNGKFRKAIFWLSCCSQVSGIKDRHEMAMPIRLLDLKLTNDMIFFLANYILTQLS